MADSLQDQLRALGLAKQESAKRRARGKKRGDRQKRSQDCRATHTSQAELSLAKAYSLREREERKQADSARKRKLAEDRRRREINKAIREIVTAQRQNDETAEVARNFLYKGRIRKIHVTPEQQTALAAGQLGIVFLTGGYHLLPPEYVEAVRDISAEHVVDLGGEAE